MSANEWTLSKRKLKRIENKRKKLSALYEITRLNDNDKQNQSQKQLNTLPEKNSEVNMASGVAVSINQDVHRKRLNPVPLTEENLAKESTDSEDSNVLSNSKKPK